MQLAPNRKAFDCMAELFCTKWRPLEEYFVEYFKTQWLGVHSNWFEGAAVYTPSTNNALESHNAVIKRKITFRKRLPLDKFLLTMKEMTQDVSKQFSDGVRIIAEEPCISKETWTKAATMNVQKFKAFKAKKTSDDKTTYVVPSSKCDLHNANEIYFKSLVRREWQSFDEYINFGFQQFWKVNLAMTNWDVSSSCTCPSFLKQHMCKHIIALAVRDNGIEIPELANPVLLAKRRGAGRIANATRALEYQNDDSSNQKGKQKNK